MTLRQQYALIEFLVAFYGDVIPVRSFTPIFYDEHKLWLTDEIIEPFANEGLGSVNINDLVELAETYEKERNDYLS